LRDGKAVSRRWLRKHKQYLVNHLSWAEDLAEVCREWSKIGERRKLFDATGESEARKRTVDLCRKKAGELADEVGRFWAPQGREIWFQALLVGLESGVRCGTDDFKAMVSLLAAVKFGLEEDIFEAAWFVLAGLAFLPDDLASLRPDYDAGVWASIDFEEYEGLVGEWANLIDEPEKLPGGRSNLWRTRPKEIVATCIARVGLQNFQSIESRLRGMEYVSAVGTLLYLTLLPHAYQAGMMTLLDEVGILGANLGVVVKRGKSLGTAADKYPRFFQKVYGVPGRYIKSFEVVSGFLSDYSEWGASYVDAVVSSLAPPAANIVPTYEEKEYVEEERRWLDASVVGYQPVEAPGIRDYLLVFERWATAGASSTVRVDLDLGTEKLKRRRVTRRMVAFCLSADEVTELSARSRGRQEYAIAVKRNDAAANRIINGAPDGQLINESFFDDGLGEMRIEQPASTLTEDVEGTLARLVVTNRLLVGGDRCIPADFKGFDTLQTEGDLETNVAWMAEVARAVRGGEFQEVSSALVSSEGNKWAVLQDTSQNEEVVGKLRSIGMVVSDGAPLDDPGRNGRWYVKLEGDLRSGKKSTARQGTDLNFAWVRIAVDAAGNFSWQPSDSDFFWMKCKGDDNLTTTRKLSGAIYVIGFVNASGKIVNVAKFYIPESQEPRTQFLRQEATQNQVVGFPARSVRAWMQRDPLSDRFVTVFDEISTVATVCGMSIRRGLDTEWCLLLAKTVTRGLARDWSIPEWWLSLQPDEGGVVNAFNLVAEPRGEMYVVNPKPKGVSLPRGAAVLFRGKEVSGSNGSVAQEACAARDEWLEVEEGTTWAIEWEATAGSISSPELSALRRRENRRAIEAWVRGIRMSLKRLDRPHVSIERAGRRRAREIEELWSRVHGPGWGETEVRAALKELARSNFGFGTRAGLREEYASAAARQKGGGAKGYLDTLNKLMTKAAVHKPPWIQAWGWDPEAAEQGVEIVGRYRSKVSVNLLRKIAFGGVSLSSNASLRLGSATVWFAPKTIENVIEGFLGTKINQVDEMTAAVRLIEPMVVDVLARTFGRLSLV
jgi:hypothetical protein